MDIQPFLDFCTKQPFFPVVIVLVVYNIVPLIKNLLKRIKTIQIGQHKIDMVDPEANIGASCGLYEKPTSPASSGTWDGKTERRQGAFTPKNALEIIDTIVMLMKETINFESQKTEMIQDLKDEQKNEARLAIGRAHSEIVTEVTKRAAKIDGDIYSNIAWRFYLSILQIAIGNLIQTIGSQIDRNHLRFKDDDSLKNYSNVAIGAFRSEMVQQINLNLDIFGQDQWPFDIINIACEHLLSVISSGMLDAKRKSIKMHEDVQEAANLCIRESAEHFYTTIPFEKDVLVERLKRLIADD